MCCVLPIFCPLDRAAAALGTGHLPTRPTSGGPQCTGLASRPRVGGGRNRVHPSFTDPGSPHVGSRLSRPDLSALCWIPLVSQSPVGTQGDQIPWLAKGRTGIANRSLAPASALHP